MLAYPSTSPNHQSLPSNGAGRRVGHQTHACLNCRQARKRCEPSALGCLRCVKNGVHCNFPNLGTDGRTLSGRCTASYKALLQLLREKEAQVQNLQIQLRRVTERGVSIDKLASDIDQKLVLCPPGLRSYGPTSPYHLKPSICKSISEVPRTAPLHKDIPWTRYLPDQFPIDMHAHEQLVNLFFESFAFWCLLGNRVAFYSAMVEVLSSSTTIPATSAHYGPALHNIVLAIAMAFTPDLRFNNLESRMIFVKKAQEYVTEAMESPTLSDILACSYLVTFFNGIGKRAAASTYFGVCVGMAKALGLGVDTSKMPTTIMSEREKYEREWLFWVIFCQDKCLALHLGRDTHLPRPQTSRPFVLSHEREVDNAVLFLCLKELYLTATNVLETIYHHRRVTRDIMFELLHEVDSWVEHVPHYLRVLHPIQEGATYDRGQLMLFLTYEWIKLCVHRPFYRPMPHSPRCPSWTKLAIEESDHAAMRILELIQAYGALRELHRIPLCAVPIAFLAGVIFIYQVERLRGLERASARTKLEGIIGALSVMEATWPCAGQARLVLRQYREQFDDMQHPGESIMIDYNALENGFLHLDPLLPAQLMGRPLPRSFRDTYYPAAASRNCIGSYSAVVDTFNFEPCGDQIPHAMQSSQSIEPAPKYSDGSMRRCDSPSSFMLTLGEDPNTQNGWSSHARGSGSACHTWARPPDYNQYMPAVDN